MFYVDKKLLFCLLLFIIFVLKKTCPDYISFFCYFKVRPTKEKTATPKSCWRDQMTLLCNAAHTLLSALFPDAVDMYKDSEMVITFLN